VLQLDSLRDAAIRVHAGDTHAHAYTDADTHADAVADSYTSGGVSRPEQ
jgi:hypothetical protein